MQGDRSTRWRWRQVDLVGLGACAALTVGAFLLGVRPALSQHSTFLGMQEELTARHRDSGELAGALGKLQDQYAALQEQLAASPLRLEAAAQTNLRLAKVTDLATECGLKVDAIQPGTAVAGARFDVVPIRLTAKGKYVTCVRFLDALHRGFPDTGVVSFELGSSSGDPNADDFQFDLEWYAAPTLADAE